MTLTKREIAAEITEQTGMGRTQVLEVMQRTFDCISASLAKGNRVELRNFGIFQVKLRKGRVGRNPKHPEVDVPIAAHTVVKFKAGKEMRAEVLKLAPKPAKVLNKRREKPPEMAPVNALAPLRNGTSLRS
jgi:DNA-binding protein HU-beta/integration host factor subunit alpha